jgi:hypothetical protein
MELLIVLGVVCVAIADPARCVSVGVEPIAKGSRV